MPTLSANKPSTINKAYIILLIVMGGSSVLSLAVFSLHSLFASLFPIFIIGGFISMIVGPIALVVILLNARSRASQSLFAQLQAFAQRNGLYFYEYLNDQQSMSVASQTILLPHESSLFTGFASQFKNTVGSPLFSLTQFSYTTEANRPPWCVGTVRLSQKLPHVILDGRANNLQSFQSLAENYRSNQIVNAEPAFTQAFSVYTPKGEAIDVLSFLAPDLMQLLLQYYTNYDIEIIDDTLMLYQYGQMDTTSALDMLMHMRALSSALEDNLHGTKSATTQETSQTSPKSSRLVRKKSTPVYIGSSLIGVMIFFNFFSGSQIHPVAYMTIALVSVPLLLYWRLRR